MATQGPAPMKWFRFYHEALHDAKVQLLRPELFKAWVNVLCAASSNSRRGEIPPIRQVAYVLQVTPEVAQSYIDELEDEGLIDRDEDGTLMPHNWHERQPESDDAAGRMRRIRAEKHAHPEPDRTCSERPNGTRSEHVPNKFGVEERRGEEKRKEAPAPHATAGSHAECVQAAKTLFGDEAAGHIADKADDIRDTLGGRFDCYVSGLQELKGRLDSGRVKSVDNFHPLVLRIAGDYVSGKKRRPPPRIAGKPATPAPYVPEKVHVAPADSIFRKANQRKATEET